MILHHHEQERPSVLTFYGSHNPGKGSSCHCCVGTRRTITLEGQTTKRSPPASSPRARVGSLATHNRYVPEVVNAPNIGAQTTMDKKPKNLGIENKSQTSSPQVHLGYLTDELKEVVCNIEKLLLHYRKVYPYLPWHHGKGCRRRKNPIDEGATSDAAWRLGCSYWSTN